MSDAHVSCITHAHDMSDAHVSCIVHMFHVLCTYSMSHAHIPCLMHIFHVSCTYSMSHAHIRTYIYTHSHTNAPTHTNTNTPTAMPTNTHAFALKYSCIHLNTPCIHLSTQTCKRPLIHTYTHILNTHRLKTHIWKTHILIKKDERNTGTFPLLPLIHKMRALTRWHTRTHNAAGRWRTMGKVGLVELTLLLLCLLQVCSCNKLQHTATCCNMLQHAAIHCTTLQLLPCSLQVCSYLNSKPWTYTLNKCLAAHVIWIRHFTHAYTHARRHTHTQTHIQQHSTHTRMQTHTHTHAHTHTHTHTHTNTLSCTVRHAPPCAPWLRSFNICTWCVYESSFDVMRINVWNTHMNKHMNKHMDMACCI